MAALNRGLDMKKSLQVGISVIFFVFFSAVTAILLIQGDMEPEPAKSVGFIENKRSPQNELNEQDAPVDQTRASDEVGSEAQDKGEALDYADQMATYAWISSKGYFLPDDTLPYESLPDEALENLITSGDILAIHVLSDRLLERFINMPEPKNYALHERHQELLYTAAVYGSTAAIVRMGKAQARVSLRKDKSYRRDQEIKALAYYEVALMRGDRQAEVEIHQLKRKLLTPFSENDLAKAKRTSIELYDELASARGQIPGLDEFDNSIPKYVNQYYDNVMKTLEGS